MFHGEEIKHTDLTIEKKKVGENTKEMGKMSHNNAVGENHAKDFKKGDLSHVQIDEGEQINTGSVEDAIESSKQLINSKKADKSSENQELLKKIDIQKMFQKIKGVPSKAENHKEVPSDNKLKSKKEEKSISKTEDYVKDVA